MSTEEEPKKKARRIAESSSDDEEEDYKPPSILSSLPLDLKSDIMEEVVEHNLLPIESEQVLAQSSVIIPQVDIKNVKEEDSEESNDSEHEDVDVKKNKKKQVRKRKMEDEDGVEAEEEKPKRQKGIDGTPKQRRKKEDADPSESPVDKKRRKQQEKIESELPENRWWEQTEMGGEQGKERKWTSLVHNGVMFPPEYRPHGVKLLYDGRLIDLTPEQEEAATFYATHLHSDHIKKPAFRENFFIDFRKLLGPDHVVQSLDKCDFTPIYDYLQQQKEQRAKRTKEEKAAEKKYNQEMVERYGYAMVDGTRERIQNFKVEPPGLFLGRGEHPKAGCLKARITPADVTINISEDAPVPPSPVPGYEWRAVVHNPYVTWLAFWRENVNDGFKYVWFSPSSRIKGQADIKKFEIARKLKDYIDKIRANYTEEMRSEKLMIRQRATALWLIDHLALRVGNEKGEDEADTVGCCSLRVEHVALEEPDLVKFDFLGKDSMRYCNEIHVDPLVYDNMKIFIARKSPQEQLFDKLSTTNLNAHLKDQMEGLTAKVFRTFNASHTLQQELNKAPEDLMDSDVDDKVLFYNRANRQVAILCNHQRTLPKTFPQQMQRLEEKIQALKEERSELLKRQTAIKNGEKFEPENEEDEEESDDDDMNLTNDNDNKQNDKDKEKKKKSKKKRLPTDPEKIVNAIAKLDSRIKAWEIKKMEKEENKSYSMTTSKVNYLDPRITISWCRKYDVPIERIFSKALRQKFPWALNTGEDFEF